MEDRNVEYHIANIKGKLECLYKQVCDDKIDKHSLRRVLADAVCRMDIIYDKVQDIRNDNKIEVPKCLISDTSKILLCDNNNM